MMKKVAACVIAVTLTTALAACASGGSPSTSEASEAEAADVSTEEVRVEINNDLVPPATVTVYMAPEQGSRRRLGTVDPNARQSFVYRVGARNIDHRLLAEVQGAEGNYSNPFTLEGATIVRWDLSSTNVNIIR